MADADGTDETAARAAREQRFEEAVASLRVGGGTHTTETRLLVLGGALLVAGVALVIAGWYGASGTLDVGEQIPYVISGGIAGVAVTMIGAALYLRFSLARTLRYWLIRFVHEERQQTDRVTEALARIEVLLVEKESPPAD